jgi:hypothetical protein
VVNREGRVQGGKKGGLTQSAKEYTCPICGKVVKGNFGRASHSRAHLKIELAGAVLAEADNVVESGEAQDTRGDCSPGAEWACKLATGPVCNCACGGKNHGMYANAPAAEVAGAIVDSMDESPDGKVRLPIDPKDWTGVASVPDEEGEIGAGFSTMTGEGVLPSGRFDPELKSSKGKTILPEELDDADKELDEIFNRRDEDLDESITRQKPFSRDDMGRVG